MVVYTFDESCLCFNLDDINTLARLPIHGLSAGVERRVIHDAPLWPSIDRGTEVSIGFPFDTLWQSNYVN